MVNWFGPYSAGKLKQKLLLEKASPRQTAASVFRRIALLDDSSTPVPSKPDAVRFGFYYQRQFPTIVAPRNERTWLIGFAIALVLLPAKSKPTARGFVATSSTISDPESPLFKNLLPLFAITIWPVNVFVNAVPPAHSLS